LILEMGGVLLSSQASLDHTPCFLSYQPSLGWQAQTNTLSFFPLMWCFILPRLAWKLSPPDHSLPSSVIRGMIPWHMACFWNFKIFGLGLHFCGAAFGSHLWDSGFWFSPNLLHKAEDYWLTHVY
jgi:hypothetical protein